MGPGHLAIAFATKPVASKAPLWSLLVASEALDLLYFGFAALGMENPGVSSISLAQGLRVTVPGVLPWSHGLFMSVVWSLLTAAITYLFYRDRRLSIIFGLVVFSHWILDFFVHPGELPLLFYGSPTVGLGLWTSGPGLIAAIFLDFGLLIGGIVVYILWKRKE